MDYPGVNIIVIALMLWTVVLIVPLAVFVAECYLAVWSRRRSLVLAQCPRRKVEQAPEYGPALRGHASTVVLIPAHNEESGLAQTLRSVLPTLGPRGAVLVVADNCTDRTADVARDHGVRVLERHDTSRRGKGFALAHGIEALRTDPPEVLVILDADCRVNDETIQFIAAEAHLLRRPTQAASLYDDAVSGPSLRGISALGTQFKNLVRPLGLAQAGGPCHLLGSGMAFPWYVVEQVEWGTDHLVEDMQMGVDLALLGYPAHYCPQVAVWSSLPDGTRGFDSQRTRWEQGHLQTLFTQVPRLIGGAIRQRRSDLLLLALDLSVPPFSLLVLLWCATLGSAVAGWMFAGISPLPAQILAGAGVAMLSAIMVGWWSFCRHRIPLTTLLFTPFFMLRKLPIYATYFLGRRQKSWIRTERSPAVGTR